MGQTNSEELRIQKLIARYLQFHSPLTDSKSHLDEDSLNAFVEGRLSPPESSSVLKHLVDCSFCLHITAELAMLECAFAEAEISAAAPAARKPEKVSDVLSGLLSKIFGTSDGAVFAHQEDKEETKKED
ncbi:MAG: hypothetical protein ACR2LT_08000 [Pyrinomonadaceae bacterium]